MRAATLRAVCCEKGIKGMNRTGLFAGMLGLAALVATPVLADNHAPPRKASPQTPDVTIINEMPLPDDAVWKHSFDAYKAEAGKVNPALRRALSFAKAMEAVGVEGQRVKVAIVVHGPSVFDVASDARYAAKYDTGDTDYTENPNADVIAQLAERGAEIWVCGVAAKYHGVGNDDLLDGVKMAPSGTAAHADLQRRGFGINPY